MIGSLFHIVNSWRRVSKSHIFEASYFFYEKEQSFGAKLLQDKTKISFNQTLVGGGQRTGLKTSAKMVLVALFENIINS